MRELLFSVTKKDLDIKFFSGIGAGGQHRNKHQNCVRLTHHDSGVTVTGQTSRSREQNLKEAFRSLTCNKEFKSWLKRETSMRLYEGVSIEEKVKQMMKPENLKIEVIPNEGT